MAPPQRPLDELAAAFQLGAWRVDPSLNRLTHDGKAVRVEPKMMDVLQVLAGCPREVVSKDTIANAVWPDVFITESVITRAIAGLRRALGDDARMPRYIETIAKRGYRLLEVPILGDQRPESPTRSKAPAWRHGTTAPPPIGQWVCGESFVGREVEIAEILDGPRNGIWLLGTRAVGKTSLLKQLELLTADNPDSPYLPVFWDLQGCTDLDDFHHDFLDALGEAEDRFAHLGLQVSDLETDSFFRTLGRVRRALRARNRTLLLLWDEVEELIHLHANQPSLLRKLRRALLSQSGIRTVMASSTRLWRLADQRADTSPFLHGFAPPLYLGPLDDAAATALVQQYSDPERHDPSADDDARRNAVVTQCGGHPSLLHLLVTRLRELGDLDQACAAVAADATVHFLFAVDFDLLAHEERELLRTLAADQGPNACQDPATAPATQNHLQALARLGLVRFDPEQRATIANPFLRQWLRNLQNV